MKRVLNSSWRFGLLLATLLLGGIIINVWQRTGEAHIDRRSLSEFPAQVGLWQQVGSDERFDKATENSLRASDYVARVYQRADGRRASFYVGYYATQSTGATYHSPLNCLPGAGWTMNDPALIKIKPANGAPAFEANRYLVQNGNDRQLLVYWYQGRGRFVASEYWGKVYTVLDSLRYRRSDGAMVRIMIPLGRSENETLETAAELAGQIAPVLPAYVPN